MYVRSVGIRLRLRPGPGRRRGASVALLTLVVLGAPTTASALPGYCEPQNTQYDPSDVQSGGSELLSPRGVSRTTIQVDGLDTFLLTSGPRHSREAVVFLHGSPGSSQEWLDLLPRAGAMGRRAVAWDLPGFGHADKPFDARNDLVEATRLLDHMLTRLGIDRVHFVVHDVGGAPALQWASEHPARLVSIVQIASGLIGYRHHDFARISRTPSVGETFVGGLNRQTFQNNLGPEERPLPQSFKDRLYDDFDRATRCSILRIYRSADEPEINAWGTAQAAVLSRKRRPALILWGRNDTFLPPEMAERQREAFPGAAVHVFEDSGHWPFIDDAPRAAGLFTPFIRCVPTGRRDRIRLAVSPAVVRRGQATRVRFRATVGRDGRTRPVCGARVTVAGRAMSTDSFGRAVRTIRLRGTRNRRVTATKSGLRRGSARLRVLGA